MKKKTVNCVALTTIHTSKTPTVLYKWRENTLCIYGVTKIVTILLNHQKYIWFRFLQEVGILPLIYLYWFLAFCFVFPANIQIHMPPKNFSFSIAWVPPCIHRCRDIKLYMYDSLHALKLTLVLFFIWLVFPFGVEKKLDKK